MILRISLTAILLTLYSGVTWAQDGVELAKQARQALATHCYRCHGENGQVEGGVGYILDLRQLVARGKVVPGSPDKSGLLTRIINGEMPADGEAVPPATIELLRKWIADGAPDANPVAAKRDFIAPFDMLHFMAADLDLTPSGDRRFIRYLTLTHLYNAGQSEEELKLYRQGLSKLVNSLSWGPKVVAPKPVDPGATILRIDLRNYKWTASLWEKIVAVNPYKVEVSSPTADRLKLMTGTGISHVRADWFVAKASVPPLYHEILEIPQTDKELEDLLGVDVEKNLAATTSQNKIVARAGFNGSGVSQNNRMVERHPTRFGYYWKSYDFSGNSGRKNLFSHPLGPEGVNAFEHDGGEIIFSLPNGLQGYMLTDAKGNRIDKGPITVVSDPKRPDRAVVNGLSCMSCHSQGMIPKDDQIQTFAFTNFSSFDTKELGKVFALYRPKAEFNQLIRQDSNRFLVALRSAGVPDTKVEPVMTLSQQFESEVTLGQAASETGVTKEEFLQGLVRSPELARVFGPLRVKGGSVQREVLVENFSDLVREFGLSVETINNSIGMRLALIPAGEFLMGSPASDKEAEADEKPQHREKIAKRFYLGTHEVTLGQYRKFISETRRAAGPGFAFSAAKSKFVSGPAFTWENSGIVQDDNQPVVNVSWDDAQAFCRWLSTKEQVVYRLPTEAEWERACRAGTNSRYWSGNDAKSLQLAGNVADEAFRQRLPFKFGEQWFDGYAFLAPEGKFRCNNFGLFNMHGNVWEWCDDAYRRDYTESPAKASDRLKVVRGGCWLNGAKDARAASRAGFTTDSRNVLIGFRVVREVE